MCTLSNFKIKYVPLATLKIWEIRNFLLSGNDARLSDKIFYHRSGFLWSFYFRSIPPLNSFGQNRLVICGLHKIILYYVQTGRYRWYYIKKSVSFLATRNIMKFFYHLEMTRLLTERFFGSFIFWLFIINTTGN